MTDAAHDREEDAMMWGPWDGWWGFGMGLGMLLFFALIIVGIVLLLRPVIGSEPRRERSRALEILDERFARGEIDREEYEERRRTLETGRS